MSEAPEKRICVYCITEAADGERFSVAGIGGVDDVPYAITESVKDLPHLREDLLAPNPRPGEMGLAAVVSDLHGDTPEISKEVLTGHQRVLEEVMKDRPILPVAFGTICDDADTVRYLLGENASDLCGSLKMVRDRVELGLKVFWNLETILKEVAERDEEVLRLKEHLRRHPELTTLPNQVEAGRAVEAALQRRKDTFTREILSRLACIAAHHCLNEEFTDEMVLNAAFLVDKSQEAYFDKAVNDLGERHKDHLQFLYSGPWPPYNFAQLVVTSGDLPTIQKEENNAFSG